jgi:hypothetical protein
MLLIVVFTIFAEKMVIVPRGKSLAGVGVQDALALYLFRSEWVCKGIILDLVKKPDSWFVTW